MDYERTNDQQQNKVNWDDDNNDNDDDGDQNDDRIVFSINLPQI